MDTYAYFGEPFTPIRLKEGINDGFLTPFKVKQIATTLDDYLYSPDDKVIEGEIEEGKRYREPQFNRTIEIEERERYQREKTLVFCASQGHALLVRDIVNQMNTSSDPNYCMRVTADDGEHNGFGRSRATRRRSDDPDDVAKALNRRGRAQCAQHRAHAADQHDD